MTTITRYYNGKKLGINEDAFTDIIPSIMAAIKRTADKVAVEIEKVSKDTYMKKRITDKSPSLVFSSFRIDSAKSYNGEIRAIVFCGGPTAPHAQYLENDRRLRNNKMWSSVNGRAPYKYMEEGIKHGAKITGDILIKEIKRRSIK